MQQKQSLQNQFVSYEIAKELKELGFDEECLAYFLNSYDTADELDNIKFNEKNHIEFKIGSYKYLNIQDVLNSSIFIICPLYQQVIDWFREKHNLHLSFEEQPINYSNLEEYGYSCFLRYAVAGIYSTWVYNKDNYWWNNYHKLREQAILKAIELIKK